MKRIAYIISHVTKSLAFEWIVEELDSTRFTLVFILMNSEDSPLEQYLRTKDIHTRRIHYSTKKDIPAALFTIYKILKQERIDIVHTHLFEASLVGLAAAQIARVKRRIHTRHNATIHHVYHPHAVKYDRLINYLSTDIIAISENVRSILVNLEHADPKKITLIPHGFRLDQFSNAPSDRIEVLRKKLQINISNGPAIGVISRYIHWKGVQYIIPAFSELLSHYPDAKLILANANGPFTAEIKKQLERLPTGSYIEIPFESDVYSLYSLFDIFVHTPIDQKSEAFGQVYVEALAAGIPSIFTLSGIACEFIKDRENAVVVPFKNSDAIRDALLYLLDNSEFCRSLSRKGKISVEENFTLERMIRSIETLYEK
jgi:glycosyltransferase involved in cell wall biosynthesis